MFFDNDAQMNLCGMQLINIKIYKINITTVFTK